jgi:hypothetical protein
MKTEHLAVGLVILISIAISLGLVFLLVLIGLLIALRHRHKDGGNNTSYPVGVHAADNNAEEQEKSRHRPTSLLATLNAATAMMTTDNRDPKGPSRGSPSSSFVGQREPPYAHDDGVLGGAAAASSGAAHDHHHDHDEDDLGVGEPQDFETHARYSFEAEREGELSIRTNDPVLVLDHSDSQWWLAQLPTGERGVVPAACLL